MASLGEFSPEATALSKEVLQQTMSHGEPSNINEPNLGRETTQQIALTEGFAEVFVCFNGERTVPDVFRDPETGIEHYVDIVAHVNVIPRGGTSSEPDRFYWLTTEGDVILSERWIGQSKQSTSRMLKPAEITYLIETIANGH